MISNKKIKNDFLYILAIGFFLNFSLYFWYGFWDSLDTLNLSNAASYIYTYDNFLTCLVIIGSILMSVAFFIEAYRVKQTLPIILSILSLFHVYFAFIEFSQYNISSYHSQIDSILYKLACDILELLMVVIYILKSRRNHKIGEKLLKTGLIIIPTLIFIAIIVGISTGLATFILLDFCFLIAIIFPVGLLFCTNNHPLKVEKITPFEKNYEGTIKFCPECGEMNENIANFCIECGFEIERN